MLEPQEPKATYLESLLDDKAFEIGSTKGEDREDAIQDYGSLKFRLDLVNAHKDRLEKQMAHAMADLQKELDEFYQLPMAQEIAATVGGILSHAKTLCRIEGQKAFLANYIDASPEISE